MAGARLKALVERDRALVRFLLTGVGGYALWYVVYEAVLKPFTRLDEAVIASLVHGTRGIGSLLGAEMRIGAGPWPTEVGLVGHAGVTIGTPCDGVVLFALFAVFVAAFPGNWKHKLWFVPAGIAVLFGVNLGRVVALTFIQAHVPELLKFNHDYTFTVGVYGVVLGLWYVYVTQPQLRCWARRCGWWECSRCPYPSGTHWSGPNCI